MELSPRHRMILKFLVEDFVTDNRPVASKTLCEKYEIGLSSASIRTVLKELEDYGYVISRHTSGGRVPTERGYRIYVDNLVSLYELGIMERQRIQEEYLRNQFKLEQILKATARVLSSLSEAAGVVIAPEKSLDTVKHVELIHVNGEELLMIIVMRSGTVVHRNLFVGQNISQETLYQISRFLNDNIKGYDTREIHNHIIPKLLTLKEGPEAFYIIAKSLINGFTLEEDEETLFIDGLKNIYENLKDNDRELHTIMSLLDEKTFIRDFLKEYKDLDGVFTIIGKDGDTQLSGVSIIASNYKMGEKRIGSLGIIGPQRMRYDRALPLVEFTSKLVSEMITKMSR